MRRLRLLLVVAVLAVSLRWLPSAFCGREASALLDDDPALGLAMARRSERWHEARLSATDSMTGSERFDGEWLFGTSMMAALGHAQLARAHPRLRDEQVRAMEACIERLLTPQVRAFDRAAWGRDPLDDLGTDRAHAAYLGYLGLVLSVHRVLEPEGSYAELHERVMAHLDQALRTSPIGLVQTYPGEIYPVDNASIIGALALHQRVTGVDHRQVLEAWAERLPSLRDSATGLLVQAVSPRGEVVDGPRGSGTGLAVYFLSFGDAAQSSSLYEAMRTHMQRELLGFGAMREYPPGIEGRGDIDSGPVIMGVSISATGFSLAGSRIHGDRETFERLWSTAYLFGAPVDHEGMRSFALGGPLGDALMFALLTARPAGEWSAGS
ncbi:hypothetical protein [Paraliomyxa miuraensis]|uniref:hypothetical protein n=1 Tax=Paraliomyxa miuraensis TaxID=376150 RepID=UPI0022574FF7|nr:hypothetical protein [Paraliomyxa miuraensis]MCX4246791.1 hypothetical protein [Paraliomyxa miuraensis]